MTDAELAAKITEGQRKAEHDAFKSGYARANSTRWYARGPGLPELQPSLFEVHIEAPEPTKPYLVQDTWPIAVYGKTYGGCNKVLMLRFETWENFLKFVKDLKTVSQPGLPAFANSWD